MYLILATLLATRLWNYNATNDNTHGDHWNGEDFSIFSLDSPQGTPEPHRSGSPSSEARVSLRQQSPSFAREVMKRAATASGDISEKLYIQRPGQINTSGMSEILIEVNDEPHVDDTKDESDDEYRSSNEQEVEDETVMDSPFDRSYFRFENEDSDDGRDSPAHIGGRALDAVVVCIAGFVSLDHPSQCILVAVVLLHHAQNNFLFLFHFSAHTPPKSQENLL